ncbi:hypothetical protein C8R46DRAFT_1123984 [Mycena filopes]|nr:hypothetical protein C8R46DRAFT_1364719 [Mycena filopes]KAJ7150729.1 hypothetical protein C8R46DRAFT_1123984 [Mycena filopes]
MRKGKLTAEHQTHLATYIPEYISKLDEGVRGQALTRWKQSTATKALASPAFADLDVSEIPRTVWFQTIVRKFTNYFHQIYKKDHPDEPSASTLVKSNPLLKFVSILTGRQLFANENHAEILSRSQQRVADTGINEAAAYQLVLKEAWASLSPEERSGWDAKAEDDCADVGVNQCEFGSNIHLALSTLSKGGLLGDAELMLFYAFRDVKNGDLLTGTVHGHSKHNKVNFGGEELEETYGLPWSKFAESVIPRPVNSASVLINVNEDGIVNFPKCDLENMSLVDVRFLLKEYLEQCWAHRNCVGGEKLAIPWSEIVKNPSQFYDQGKFKLPTHLKDPHECSSIEALMLADFFATTPGPFHFKPEVIQAPEQPLQVLPPALEAEETVTPETQQAELVVPDPNVTPKSIPIPPPPASPPSIEDNQAKKRPRPRGVGGKVAPAKKRRQKPVHSETTESGGSNVAVRRSSRTTEPKAPKAATRQNKPTKKPEKGWKGYELVSASEEEEEVV